MGDQDLQLSELEEEEANSSPASELDESNLDNAEAIEIPDIPRNAQDLEAVYDIPVQVSAVLGRSTMEVQELLKLGKGAVVELDRKVGEAIDIFVNNRLVARGEVVVLEDRLGITMTEIIKTDRI
ncbi:MAG: flagellar motor switch protein FliN [Rhodospirillaceae bacterium TMED167]|nr:flagellar motor switch protein FliN [Rhodospirillaceae bacterium]OUW28008.1 MAG: flagellar motor switch protein FliN [Rhodospirillaceae bacterium TMED167]|tara:strand:- start:52 stop:426 length:375 start_codon:yes stop_codon:yes gene_type:complete